MTSKNQAATMKLGDGVSPSIYIYIYIEREREREGLRPVTHFSETCVL